MIRTREQLDDLAKFALRRTGFFPGAMALCGVDAMIVEVGTDGACSVSMFERSNDGKVMHVFEAEDGRITDYRRSVRGDSDAGDVHWNDRGHCDAEA